MDIVELQKKEDNIKMIILNTKSGIVKKSELIVKGRYNLNPLAIKLITLIIANMKLSDDLNTRYTFKIKDFSEMTSKNYGEIYNELDEAVEELLKQPLHIKLEDGWLKANWISSARYEEGKGQISFRIDPELRPYLLEAKEKFLKYNIENILKLNSKYSIRTYEILKDYLETLTRYGKSAEKIIELTWLREVLQIPESYKYNKIKTRILEKAKKEFEKHTDIIFEYEEIKTGRKVTHLKFIIKPNPAKLQTDDRIQDNYFKSRKAFVALLRKNYSGNGKFWGFKTIDGASYWLGLDNNGLVYATSGKDIKDFNAVESERIYEFWLKVAQNSELYKELISEAICLKDWALNNKGLWLEFTSELIRLKEEGII